MIFPAWSKAKAQEIAHTFIADPGPVLIALQGVQRYFGYVHPEAVAIIANEFNVSRADVHGVLTFYHDLRMTPPPKNLVQICAAEACQAVGARELIAAAENYFLVKADAQADAQAHEVEIKSCYCFGNCALGPAATVNGKLLGKADLAKIVAQLQ